MEKEIEPTEEYLKGFNQMYALKREMSDLAQQVLSAKAQGGRSNGMKAGAKQYELKRIREVSKKTPEQTRDREI